MQPAHVFLPEIDQKRFSRSAEEFVKNLSLDDSGIQRSCGSYGNRWRRVRRHGYVAEGAKTQPLQREFVSCLLLLS